MAGVRRESLVHSVGLVVALAAKDPEGNRMAYALFEAVPSGYRLAVAIVGNSAQPRSRKQARWLIPSVVVAAVLFLTGFAFYYLA